MSEKRPGVDEGQKDERCAIDASLDESALEDEVERALLDAGLLSELRQPPDRTPASGQFEPIAVRGKPVSETIVEERR